MNYNLIFSKDFLKSYSKLVKRNKDLKNRIDNVLLLLAKDPFYVGLKTHKADTVLYGYKFSSRVTGDLRIIWDFEDGKQVILVLTILGHEVYK